MKFSLVTLAFLSGLVTAQDGPPADTASATDANSIPTATSFDDSLITLTPDIDPNDPVVTAPATTTATQITVYDYQDGIQTIHVCPTGQPNTFGQPHSYDCIEATCNVKGDVISVVVINISITIIDGNPTTVTVTKTEAPSLTPSALPSTYSSLDTSSTKFPIGTGTGITYPKGTGTAVYPHEPTHHVSVGKSGLKFSPPFVHAQTGDTVRFSFFPRNHTVTSSNLDTPCIPNGVFDSGFHPTWFQNSTQYIDYPVTNASESLFFFRYVLYSTSPNLLANLTYILSRQKNECKNGMVFAINPASTQQFKDFYTKAVGTSTSTSSASSNTASSSTFSTKVAPKLYATPIPKEKRESSWVPRAYRAPE
jgi:plastocyanin